MMSQRVERTWIRTGGYGRFRGEWVKAVHGSGTKRSRKNVLNVSNKFKLLSLQKKINWELSSGRSQENEML